MKKIIVRSRTRIPGKGMGPILVPFFVSDEFIKRLDECGIVYEIIGAGINKEIGITLEEAKKREAEKQRIIDGMKNKEAEATRVGVVNPPTIEAIKKEEVVTKEEVVEAVTLEEEIVEEEKKEEVIMNDANLSAESFYEREFLNSKNKCKKILENRKVQFKYHANANELVDLVIETNPSL